jgi:prepilin-type N-terminal cleavage/methylation domain-containing protein
MTLGETILTMASPPKGDDRTTPRSQAGFTLFELVVVVAIVGVVLSIGFMSIDRTMPQMRAERAARQVAAMMREGRTLALTKRRNVQMNFINATNRIELAEINPAAPDPSWPPSVILAGDSRFIVFPGQSDTPDGFGIPAGSVAPAVSFDGAPVTNVRFEADGFIESAPDEPMNGTVFVGVAGRPDTAHAVTVMGATGRVRIWRWNPTTGLWTRKNG